MSDIEKARKALAESAAALGVDEVVFITKLAEAEGIIAPHRIGTMGIPTEKDWALVHAAKAVLADANKRLIRAGVLWEGVPS